MMGAFYIIEYNFMKKWIFIYLFSLLSAGTSGKLSGFVYDIDSNNPFGPIDLAWIYQGSGSTNFFSDVQSGAFRLPNGNTLITEANEAHIFEVTPDGTEVWYYEYPGNNAMIARAPLIALNA